MITATATEMQNNFGRYLNLVMSGQEIIVTKNGREVGRFIPRDAAVSYLTDSLTGILKGDYDLEEAKAERLKEKYGSVLEKAVEMKWSDFEDAVQSATAERVHADYVITRNIRDFGRSKIMALTPTEFLARI